MRRAAAKPAVSTTMTVRLPVRLKRRLAVLAETTDRSASFLTVEAIESYVDLNEWQVAAIREGVADADAERFVEHDDVDSWLKTWGQPRTPRRVRSRSRRAG